MHSAYTQETWTKFFLLKEVSMKAIQPKWFAIGAMTLMLCLAGLVNSGTAFAESPQSLCVDNGDGTVTDNGTGLMWQKANTGQMDWYAAMSNGLNLTLGGYSDWRLPDKNELEELYYSPCKDFLNIQNDWYWSSNTRGSHSEDYAWFVHFKDGNVRWHHKSSFYYARAVRSAQ